MAARRPPVGLDEAVGSALATARAADMIDVAVVLGAIHRCDLVVTSDPGISR